MCSSGCSSLNNWVSRSVRNVKFYSRVIKWGMLISLFSLTGVKMSSDYINITINPMVLAGALVIIFLSHPTIDLFKFKMLAYFNFKGRLNDNNRENYNGIQTKL
jgi:hypothetical protein